jgi:hypothetical protein
LRLAVEKVKERQEGELINNADYGLLSQATSGYRISTRKGAPTPAQSQRSVRPANALCTRARLRPAFAGLSFFYASIFWNRCVDFVGPGEDSARHVDHFGIP